MIDEVFKSEFDYIAHEDRLVHRLTQPSEDLILERNRELRKNKGVIKDLGSQGNGVWGRQVASIPQNTYEWAIRNGYELNSKDKVHREKELWRFLKSDKGRPCMVR